ncbi:aldo/keto reductase [Microbacterium excoecariae]|uniref:aldo/keto reductase n=1 Tax=Microbacterium excoecariae TaxID=2715210 RepID=UPI001407ABE4|nr:aldo/keto reductase [Microbacterium excoecariae]NHI15756.1 aldo/keto reductase [Microbacterium excoecariae]
MRNDVHAARPVDVEAVTFGTSGLGRGTRPGSVEEEAAVETAVALLRSGALVDTAHIYAEGRSEEVLGLGLAELAPGERAAAAGRIVTKVDRDPATGIFDADQVRRSHEESLARLGLDRVRRLHVHDPYVVAFAAASAPGGIIDAMVGLREEGSVDAIGIAAGRNPVVAAYVATGVFDMVLSHNRFTLVDQSAAPVFAAAREKGMRTFNAAPFGGDLLAKGSRAGATYGYRPASDALRVWTEGAEGVCARWGVPLAAAALQFSTRSPLVDSTVVSATRAARVREIRDLASHPVPDGLWQDLAALSPAPSPIDDGEAA